MKKGPKTLILLAAGLIICIGAYVGISMYNKHEAEKKNAEQSATAIYPSDLGAISKISYHVGNQTLSFVKDQDIWYWVDSHDFPLNQPKLSTIASSLSSLSAVRSFDAQDSLSDYGLAQPFATITSTDDNGKTFTLQLGEKSGENYYAKTEDGNKVYTIDATLAECLEPDILKLIVLDDLPTFDSSTLEKVKLDAADRTLSLDKHKEKDDSNTWFIVDGGNYIPSDKYVLANPAQNTTGRTPKELVSSAITALSSFDFSSCAVYKPSGDDLATFGLTTPVLTLTVDCQSTTVSGEKSEKTVVVSIGGATADGSGYYAQLLGSDQVGIVPKDAVEPLLAAMCLGQVTIRNS